MGHTASAWTPAFHPQRELFELLGIDLRVPHHTAHHQRPLTNFGKRTTLWDRLLGTHHDPAAKAAAGGGGGAAASHASRTMTAAMTTK